jgi:hypothetical protein
VRMDLPTCLPPARMVSFKACEGLSSTGSTTLQQQYQQQKTRHTQRQAQNQAA